VERVLEDVRLGYVSRESARADYGVEIREDGSVNRNGTDRLRAAKANSKGDVR
jgi:N-methylhydantoinase B